MYTDDDLQSAIKAGVLDQPTVDALRSHLAQRRGTATADEEPFRLVTSFNDVFVLIACAIVLVSIGLVFKGGSYPLGAIGIAASAWLLAEFFTRRRRMALPSIALLLAFVGGVWVATGVLLDADTRAAPSRAEEWLFPSAFAALAALVHWFRFKVPITVAAGTAALAMTFLASMAQFFNTSSGPLFSGICFVAGLGVFVFAMYWDSRDVKRLTYRSDVAFWLHVLAAPMIIHSLMGIFNVSFAGPKQTELALTILAIYFLMAVISLAIDRRALMVSGLVYVLVALTEWISVQSGNAFSFPIVGLTIGSALLLLSAFWQRARQAVLKLLPPAIKQYLAT